MSIERPPIQDNALATYLLRVLSSLSNGIDSCKTFIVNGQVKNPLKGKLYLAETVTHQFSAVGLYYYNGTTFVKLADSLASLSLGTLHTNAYFGDLGDIAYRHSQTTGNPHETSPNDIGLGNVNNTSDINKPVSNSTIAELLKYVLKTTRVNNKALSSDIMLTTADVPATYNRRYLTYDQQTIIGQAASATTDGYLLGSDWVIFNAKQDALGFTPENVANKAVAWASPTDTQYASAKLVNDTFALYLPLSSYHLYYRGKFTTLSALTTAILIASAGDYAQVDTGIGDEVTNYNWDDEAGWVIGSPGSGATNTDGLPEGSTNLYFTAARVIASLLTGFSAAVGTVGSTDSILVAINKIVGNFNTPASYPTLNQNTTGSAAKLTTARTINGVSFDGTANITNIAEATHAATSKATPVDADELPLVDSAASNVLKKLTWANAKATLKTYFDTLYAPVSNPWDAWSITFTNFTQGNGTVTAAYSYDEVNKICHYYAFITLGSTSSMSSVPIVSLPVTSAASPSAQAEIGRGRIKSSTTRYELTLWWTTTGGSQLLSVLSGVPTPISATSPHTWAAGDTINFHGFFRTA